MMSKPIYHHLRGSYWERAWRDWHPLLLSNKEICYSRVRGIGRLPGSHLWTEFDSVSLRKGPLNLYLNAHLVRNLPLLIVRNNCFDCVRRDFLDFF